MRYHCQFCGKSVTSELPDDAVIRAVLICPECLEHADQTLLEPALNDLSVKSGKGVTR